MSIALFRVHRRRVGVRRPHIAAKKSDWLDVAEAAILYFGVTLLPLLVVILLYVAGVIV